jgi:hypothetical protein
MTGLYPKGTNTSLDLTGDPGAAFYSEGLGVVPAQFDRIYAQAAGEIDKLNISAKGNFDAVTVPAWINKASVQQRLGQVIDPKPIAPPALSIARQDMEGVGMWVKQISGDPVSICPDLPAPPPPPVQGSIAASVPGQQSYDQQFQQLRGMIAAAKVEILAAIKAKG